MTDKRIGYILIILLISLHYISISGIYLQFTKDILPAGDPFTYTIGFFNLLDLAHLDFWSALGRAFTANWYWLLNILTVIFSPILIKEAFSISIVNFVMWTFASISLFKLGSYLKLGFVFSFLATFLIWFFPINFGFLDYASIPVLGLDSIFIAAVQVALFFTIIYSLDPTNLKNSLIAGISVGVAVWGRGNSLPVVGMIIFVPLLFILYRLWKREDRRLVIGSLTLFTLICIAFMTIFFILQGRGIFAYYNHHMHFVTRHIWSIHDAMPYLKNIPGFFFWRDENSLLTILISISFHFLSILSLVVGFSSRRKSKLLNNLYIICITGAFIYFSTYFINIILFTDPHMNIYNCLLIYAPMRIGIAISLFTLFATFMVSKNISIRPWVIIPASVLFILYGVILTKHNIPTRPHGAPTATKVEAVSKNIEDILEGRTLSMLWYQYYNPRIFSYYRIKNNLPDIKYYRNKYHDEIWLQYDYSESKRLKVREEIKKHFEEASFIVLPEYVNYYDSHFATAFAKMSDEFAKYLNSQNSKQFFVRAILYEADNRRLLIIQRKNEAKGSGEPLKLPYGPSSKPIKEDYGQKVIRY